MRVLHIAPINVAGVPYAMVDMQRRFGTTTRLVTLHKNPLTFPEDICLNLPLPRSRLAGAWRNHKRESVRRGQHSLPPVYGPRNVFERMFFRIDDARRRPAVEQTLEAHGLGNFDIIHYDGGMDFFRDARLARKWKQDGKKIVCHYMGSDLRDRGLHPTMDRISDLNLTNESDHLLLHRDIHYIFIPFDASAYRMRSTENRTLRIVHSPTNRTLKGTAEILPVIERIKKLRNVKFVLLENMPHDEVLRVKQTCDIAIEQVGNFGGTGYGRNSLETLAMGIPTITDMTKDYLEWLPEHPFVVATPETLFDRLMELIDNAHLRKEFGSAGRGWVERYHSYESVHARLLSLYRDHGII